MRHPFDKTHAQQLEGTILLGLKTGSCPVSAGRMEECLHGMDASEREGWREGFRAAEGLTAEAVPRGVLFSRLGPEGPTRDR